MQVIPLGIINERVDTGLRGFIGVKESCGDSLGFVLFRTSKP